MKTIPISAIFDIEYGNKFNLNKLDQVSSGVAFISRSGQNNGYKCDVSQINGVAPYSSGLITVAMNGAILSAFVQPRPFYTAQKIKVLKPKVNMSLAIRLAYCTIIYANRFRYTTHGREADITFDNLLVPSPEYLADRDSYEVTLPSATPSSTTEIKLSDRNWHNFRYDDVFAISEIFDIEYGNKLDLNKLDQVSSGVAFIARSSQNNGYKCDVSQINGMTPYNSGLITVAMGGSVLSAFLQLRPFYTGQNIKVLRPRDEMSLEVRLAYCTVISANRFRYAACGREANITFDDLLVPSPQYLADRISHLEVITAKDLMKIQMQLSGS